MKLLTQWAVTSSALILIVLAVRVLFRDKLSAQWRYALWGIVLLRLLVPFQVELPADTSAALPLLASNLAQDVTPWLEDQMLYAVPTRVYPNSGGVQPGEPPEYSRTLHSEANREYYSGGVRFDENGTTRYFFMMPTSELLTMLWGIGAGLCLLVILYSNWGFSIRLGRRQRPLEISDSPIPVYTAEGLASPCLFGVFRPAVYVTPQAAADPDALRHVLAHELTHYAHKDHIWSLLRIAALALHWYNPLVWLAAVLSKGDGELACDEGAVARLGEAERIPYGRTLVDMVAARSLRPVDLLSCSTAMTGGKRSIQERVARLVKQPQTAKTALFAAAAAVALAAVFTFAGRGEQRPDLYRPYRYQVGRTQAVRYSPSPLSSQSYPDAITDPDLLEEALDLLDSAADLLNTPEELDLDLSDAPFVSPRVTLLEDPSDNSDGHTYLMYTHRLGGNLEQCYLVTPAEIGAESYAVAAVLDPSAPGALELLARQQRSRSREDQAALSVYLDAVDRADSVQYVPSLYSNTFFPGIPAITGRDSVARTKEILRDISPLEAGGSPDLTRTLGLPGVTLLGVYDGGGLMQANYKLLSQDGRAYVLCQTADAGFETVGSLPETAVYQLAELAR